MVFPLDRRPVIVAIAGPNGAGKTTFYHAHLRPAGLYFVNAGVLARELKIEPCAAARLADSLRRALVQQRESFVFETVFSDPVGEKVAFLKEAARAGYTAILCFIGVSARFPRTLANLKIALRELPHVWVFDNDDLNAPFRLVSVFQNGQPVSIHKPIPKWFRPLMPN